MLSREAMGAASLAVLWLNVLLVAGAAWIDGRPLPLGARVRVSGAFIAALLAVTAGCTALALSAPRFGARSALGAVACLAVFLTMQPLGTLVRERLRAMARPR